MRENLRLDRIQINKLFGRFTYDIDLKNGYDVSILIAPNGCGKTTIFNIISFMLHPTTTGFARIAAIPYEECVCTLSNGKTVKLMHQKFKETDSVSRRMAMYAGALMFNPITIGLAATGMSARAMRDAAMHNGGIEDTLLIIGKKSISINNILNKMQGKMSDMSFVDEDEDDYYMIEMAKRYPERFVRGDFLEQEVTPFLVDNGCDLGVNFIAADRLHIKIANQEDTRHRRGYEEVEQIVDPIQVALKKTRKLYSDVRDEYAKLQSEAKDKLPKMYLHVDDENPALSEEDFISQWRQYVSDIEKYREIGLLETSDTVISNRELKKAYANKGAFLCVYLATFRETLKPLAAEYDRLKLFVDILNERNRITKKELSYGREGIILKVDGEPLPLTCMSSGEKNDFVMFYNLIFNSKKDGLVLIDEPEISLHIEWQETFLNSLLDICKMNGLQAIVATHSPNIVNGHLELYAERGLLDD